MNPHYNYHNITPIESMMIQIKEDGEKETWNWIESLKEVSKRIKYRQLYFMAKEKIGG